MALSRIGAIGLSRVGAITLSLVGARGLTLVGANALTPLGAILTLVGAMAPSQVGAIGLSRVGARTHARPIAPMACRGVGAVTACTIPSVSMTRTADNLAQIDGAGRFTAR